MEFVEPFKDIQHILALKKFFKEHSQRDYLLFVMGINTGMKINELLSLKLNDILDENQNLKHFCILHNPASGITSSYPLNSKVKEALSLYLKSRDSLGEDYLFISAKTQKPISRQQAHRIIHDALDHLGIRGRFGTGSMRKTFGYFAYIKGISISIIQKCYHHSSPSETYKYLGLTKEDTDQQVFIDVNL
ncbi:tyrosine-type recombinase/integrase [Peribacillus kribbensis]|uniref:tyrosine-type recombinase/integrase n=1 Tax=Peribacillus kribbensis TaxID=356658 RepID=UPI00040EC849|nr:tyrosine-type recombinase/integrase [Peribacillus kribbensis]